jgi:hypothetical protein
MGLRDLFKPETDRQAVAFSVAEWTVRTLTDQAFRDRYVKPVREAGSALEEEGILREFFYLLAVGTHVAFVGRIRDPDKALDLLRRCDEEITPMLEDMGIWSLAGSARFSAEKEERKREMLAALDQAPDEGERDSRKATVYPVAEVAAAHLFDSGDAPPHLLTLLSGLFFGHVRGCHRILTGIRIT